ncbi:efflux RND transporter periplasmic adaptor subunit [Halopseudomonas nanhaiensis]|uniref:efflux RND transporter periplasmic adaptor subunit n=1 Tax=Halopseudomonas nanhaiensis TaxID=2830842 RepID=UPI001CC0E842|nr:efflux RND transporter periplasmic adaptor subunit [Halopseudomonas nanhaiensis]UAW99282.1 efflux RND transporter periplasmic adaptor subunit [Halopseudomonas nanhaiensis]
MNSAAPGKRRRYVWLALAIALCVALAGWYAWSSNARGTPTYSTASAERGDVEDNITALGTLEPLNNVDVGTQVSGQLRALHVQLGDQVEEGQLLAEIDPTVYLARVEATRAQLANLRAQLADREAQQTLARLQAQRQRNLIELDATSQEQVESAEATLRSANAQIQAIEAQVRQAESALKGEEADLNYTRIYAPMGGTVVQQLANQGQTLNANQTAPIIVRVADLSTMTVRTQVSEADIAQLKVGMPAYFSTLGQPQRRWEGTLRQILPTPEVLNNVVLFNALFDVPNPDGNLLPQMSAQVFFVRAAARDVLTIPVAALKPASSEQRRSDGDWWQVEVIDAQGGIQPREVRVGIRNRVSVEVLEGLNEGEQVVTGQASTAAANRGGPSRRFM